MSVFLYLIIYPIYHFSTKVRKYKGSCMTSSFTCVMLEVVSLVLPFLSLERNFLANIKRSHATLFLGILNTIDF